MKENTPTEGTGRPQTDSHIISEKAGSAVVLSFGRMNPPTSGHQKLVDKMMSVARSKKAMPALYLSHSQDKKKNPLTYDQKIKYATKSFGKIVQKSTARTIIEVLKELSGKFDNVHIVVGGDRIQEFKTLVLKYNGKDYNFDNIEVISAGDRDPDADDISGMSASKLRALAVAGEYKQYRSGLPRKMTDRDAKSMYDTIRSAMGITEEMSLQEVLTLQQRMKRRVAMRRVKAKIKRGRRIAQRKLANPEKLKVRSSRKARELIRARLSGNKGKNYKDLPIAARIAIDKKVEKKKKIITRIAKRMLPQVRRDEVQRLKKFRQNQSRREDIDYMSKVDFVLRKIEIETITEGVEKNLMKKSAKYGVSIDELKEKYLAYKSVMSEKETFDAINSELANLDEDDKPNKRGDDAKGHKRPTEDGAGLTRKGAKAAGVKTAVTTPPSKLDPDGKAAKRRKSFCARMSGMKGPMKDEKGRPTRKAMSLKRWNC